MTESLDPFLNHKVDGGTILIIEGNGPVIIFITQSRLSLDKINRTVPGETSWTKLSG